MFLHQQLKDSPDEIAVTDLTRQLTWQQLSTRCWQMANYLRQEKSLSPGEHIALLIGNRIEFIEAIWGAMLAGLWVTPINTHLLKEDVGYIQEDSGAKLVLHDSAHANILAAVADCETINIESIGDILRNQTKDSLPLAGPAGGTMLYTSGTTGRPKGVKRNKPNTLGEALERFHSTGLLFGLNGQGPHLVTGPLYHAAPMLFALYDLINGAPMVIMPHWDNQLFVDCVKKYAVKHTHLVPTMFVRLLNNMREQTHAADFSSLDLVLHGAAPIAPSTKQQMIDWWGKILVEYWGGSEAGITTLVASDDWLSHPGTVGKPLSHFEVFIGDEQGNPVDQTVGPLYCRHKTLAQVFEYHQAAEKTQKAHPQPHVFCIGDIGRIDEEGFVYLSDRESNMIISGGVNIYPAEIEQVLLEHPAVADVGVFGVPNDEWGETVHASIELKAGFLPDQSQRESLLLFAKQKLAKFKVPRVIHFAESLPRTPTGKLLVRVLKEKSAK